MQYALFYNLIFMNIILSVDKMFHNLLSLPLLVDICVFLFSIFFLHPLPVNNVQINVYVQMFLHRTILN